MTFTSHWVGCSSPGVGKWMACNRKARGKRKQGRKKKKNQPTKSSTCVLPGNCWDSSKSSMLLSAPRRALCLHTCSTWLHTLSSSAILVSGSSGQKFPVTPDNSLSLPTAQRALNPLSLAAQFTGGKRLLIKQSRVQAGKPALKVSENNFGK